MTILGERGSRMDADAGEHAGEPRVLLRRLFVALNEKSVCRVVQHGPCTEC